MKSKYSSNGDWIAKTLITNSPKTLTKDDPFFNTAMKGSSIKTNEGSTKIVAESDNG